MAGNKYEIQLGVNLDTSNLRADINKLDNKYKLKLGVDVGVGDIRKRISAYNKNTNNAKLHLKVKLDTDDLKRQINQLNLGGTSGGKGVAIPVNTESLEKSLTEVKGIITDIKNSLGTLDNGAGMKSLLSSVNQISTALERASNQFVELNASLNSLATKDFSVNLGINMGGSNPIARNAAYGTKARGETIPQLQQQAATLEGYLKQYYKVADGFNAVQKLIQGTNIVTGTNHPMTLLPQMADGSNLSRQMTAYKQYIALIKDAASLRGIDISSVTSGFSKSANELVADAQKVQTGTNEMEDSFEKLKQVFGGNSANVEGISKQLDSIVADLGEIKTALQGLSSGVSLDGLTQSFDRLSETIETLIKNAVLVKQTLGDGLGNSVGSVGQSSNGIKNVENDLKQATITADNTADAIRNIKNAMSGMKFNNASIDAVTKDLEEMNITIEKVTAKQKNGVIQVTVKGINEAKEAVTVIKQLDNETGNFNIVSTNISKPFDEGVEAARRLKKELETVKGIKFDIENGTFDNQISQMDDNFNRLSDASNELRGSLEKVKNAYREMELVAEGTGDEVADRERLIQAEKEYAAALKQTNNLIRIQAREQKKEIDAQKLVDDRRVFQQKIDTWLTKNSAAAQKFGTEMRNLQTQAKSCDKVTLNHLEKEFKRLDSAADQAGLKMQSLGDRIKSKFKEYSAYFGVAELFMYAEQGLRDMFEQVKLIDSAMTELKKVTDETDASYDRFLTNAASRAREIGTTIDGLISSTADFARLGYGFEDAQGLAEVANIYAVVGDDIDNVEQATESLISTLTAFKSEMNDMSDSDFALSIVDKMNEVANNYAISSGGIGEALQRSASSMQAANNSLDETIALITAANTVVNLCHPI